MRGSLTKLWMNQSLLVKDRKRTLRRPLVERVPVHARLVDVEVGHRLAHLRVPVERHDRQVRVAHERLADIIDAVVRVAAEGGDADVVHVVPQDLSQHAEAVEVVVRADLAEVAATVAQLKGFVGAVQLAHFVRRDAEVVILEQMGPGLFHFWSRLASELSLQA